MSLKVVTLAGTRPELIRLSKLIERLDESCDHHFVYTGQNRDPMLSDVFMRDLGIRAPDSFFEVSSEDFSRTIAETVTKSADLFRNFRPDATVILGDTNSALAAIPSERMGIPVFHLEAGNRAFDKNVPEELNRKLVDHISTFNLAYTEHARRNLIDEGLDSRNIFVSGSPIAEIVKAFGPLSENSGVLEKIGLTQGGFILASLHRQETVDFPQRLSQCIRQLQLVADSLEVPVVFSTHPRTRSRIQNLEGWDASRILFLEPFGYLDYLKLMANALCVVSDSGTISEEAAVMGIPAVVMRDSTERPEAIESGNVLLAGVTNQDLLEKIEMLIRNFRPAAIPTGYEVEDFSRRVEYIIHSTSKLSRTWSNLLA